MDNPLYTDPHRRRPPVRRAYSTVSGGPMPFGHRPRLIRDTRTAAPPVAKDDITYVTFSNVLWTVLVGWWLSLFFLVMGGLMCITIVGFKYGLICFNFARYILFPFGHYCYREETARPNVVAKILFFIFSPIVAVPLITAAGVSWELMFYIPMAKFLMKTLANCYKDFHQLRFAPLENHNPKVGRIPTLLAYSSGSTFYFKYTIFGMEVPFLSLIPLVPIALYIGFLGKEDQAIMEPVLSTFLCLFATIPCGYVIGVCTEDLSSRCGLVLGSLVNALFTGIVELILFYFSIKKEMGLVVRAAVTGAFLMNLLFIPGLSMLFAGFKWKEVKINRNVQSVSGTILFLAIVAVFFPAIFYNIYSKKAIVCDTCNGVQGRHVFSNNVDMNCTQCNVGQLYNLDEDPIYVKMAKPLMYSVSVIMPIVYFVGLYFSMKSHKFIYDEFEEQVGAEEGDRIMSTPFCVFLLLFSCLLFSLTCEALTDRMPEAIKELKLTERFVGLVFVTLVPAIAEFMNAVRFALEGNLGLSLEIGNQGATMVSLIQIPALVLMSVLIRSKSPKGQFNLIFDMLDVFAVIISVLLRNSMLQDKSTNYFTGFAFLVIFSLITLVYYFDPW